MSVRVRNKKVRDLDGMELYSVLISTARGTPFRWGSKAYNHLVRETNKELKFRRFEEVEWFYTNVARALRNGYRGFSVKLQAKYWSGNKCNIGVTGVRVVLSHMEEGGFIELLKGSRDYRDSKKSFASIVRFKQKLVDMLGEDVLMLYIPSGCVDYPIVLKDRASKEVIELIKTEEVEEMAEEMNRYNESLAKADIRFGGEVVPLLEYQRTFSGDFKSGGRLFVHGGSIQIVPQALRLSAITIDGEAVVELDYSANHPRILYEIMSSEEGEVVPIDIDPYDCDASFLKIDYEKIEEHKKRFGLKWYNPVRNYFKHVMMRALNCESDQKAVASIANEIYNDSKREEGGRAFVGLIKPDSRLALSAICKNNQPIERLFFQDKGIWLQHLDSEIALRVIDLMLQKGEVVLCWHDSFQCRESAKDLLYTAMVEAWGEVLGSCLYVKIDQK